MIRDRNIEWLRRRRIIPASQFGFYAAAAGPTTAAAKLTAAAGGNPLLDETGSLGIAGVEVGATGDDLAVLDLETLGIADVTKEMGFRALWVNNGAVATGDSVTFTVTYSQADPGEALSAPATALDTAIAAQSPAATTTLVLHRTARGILNANTFDFTARRGGVIWGVDMAISGFSADEVQFHGLEIDYIPLVCASPEEDIDAFSSVAAEG